MLTTSNFDTSPLRIAINNAYRMDEADALAPLLKEANLTTHQRDDVQQKARQWIEQLRSSSKKQSKIDELLHQYNLSTEEGIALMCLAEALLRIPDTTTIDKFISDKLANTSWRHHSANDNSLFMNAATWSLLITGKIYSPLLNQENSLFNALKRIGSRLGAAIIRPIIMQMMKAIGNQFVMGETIETALKRATKLRANGYLFSFDMLGEAARGTQDATKYLYAYQQAIDAIGKSTTSTDIIENSGISIKLSALHPRYEYAQHERVLKELSPILLKLAQQAKQYHIGLTIDAEEADRLDLSLDLFEKVYQDKSLDGWDGLGFVVQAYQKRAPFVIDWLASLAKQYKRRIMVRLVKGAYWDSEIKQSQVNGLSHYPVFTRKHATDVSYLACAKKLFSHPDLFYPQFGTHNAFSIAAINTMANNHASFEFQCLYGMGQALYDTIATSTPKHPACRIYVPVGSHRELLGYLVRRLLEYGANNSFINKIADKSVPIEQLILDPIERMNKVEPKSHPKIPLPSHIFSTRMNSQGFDFSNRAELSKLKLLLDASEDRMLVAGSLIASEDKLAGESKKIISPIQHNLVLGQVHPTPENHIESALSTAVYAVKTWGKTDVETRATILENTANLIQKSFPELISILIREAGKCAPDAISEIREAIDFCRYYAERARIDLRPTVLPGPTGESNELSLHPRGVIACISPWNFPLAIFTGQIVASLVTGNPVIAKPAEQTPLIAYKMVQLLHQAGVPKEALQLVIGKGSIIGPKLIGDPRLAGVMFTGSTQTAKSIEQTLATRPGPIGFLIAETGGQNAMIVDSSALIEQTILDIAQSAFNSAGQRCSALRVLFVQSDIAPKLLNLLKSYLQELKIGDPRLLATDIGPVIDAHAKKTLEAHTAKMMQVGKLIAEVPMTEVPTGHFFAPKVFELNNLLHLKEEVFGPILHVIQYHASDLDQVIEQITQTGYGLTLGIQSRIDATVNHIVQRMQVGNTYVNRNMIGAVVGVQPFGGERLSGTGPKAGGPHYLPRLCVERTISVNTTAIGGNARLVSLIEDE